MSYDDPNHDDSGYGSAPPPQPGYGAPMAEHPQGTTILVLGILSLVCCGFFTGIPAIIMGKSALKESETAHYANEGSIKGGYICGIIGTVLSVLGAVAQIWLYASGNSPYS